MLTLPVLANIASFIDTAPAVASFACVCRATLHVVRSTPFRHPVRVRDHATALVVSKLPELVLHNGERRPYLDKVIYRGILHGPEVLQAAIDVELDCIICFELVVPPNVRKLTMGPRTYCVTRFTKGLVSLTVNSTYNHPLTDLPDTLEELTIGDHYTGPLTLPPKLRSLQCGKAFNRPLTLVPCLKTLVLGSSFSHPLVLNEELENLEIDGYFNHPFVFTKKLKNVRLGPSFNQPVVLNEGLETLIARGLTHRLVLVKSLKTLELPRYDEDLILNEGLVNLSLGLGAHPLGLLPSSLRNLELYGYYNHPVQLNEGLETVRFGFEYNQPTVLPSTMKIAVFGYNYNQPTVLPHGMTQAAFGWYFNQPLVCPDTMEYLELPRACGSTPSIPPRCVVRIYG